MGTTPFLPLLFSIILRTVSIAVIFFAFLATVFSMGFALSALFITGVFFIGTYLGVLGLEVFLLGFDLVGFAFGSLVA